MVMLKLMCENYLFHAPQFGAKAPICHHGILQNWHDVGVLQENYYSCIVLKKVRARGQAMVGKEVVGLMV
jgi:hypothetical protein